MPTFPIHYLAKTVGRRLLPVDSYYNKLLYSTQVLIITMQINTKRIFGSICTRIYDWKGIQLFKTKTERIPNIQAYDGN